MEGGGKGIQKLWRGPININYKPLHLTAIRFATIFFPGGLGGGGKYVTAKENHTKLICKESRTKICAGKRRDVILARQV